MKHTEKTISDFLSNDYKEFAIYTIENRAIPSVIDSFKPSQRKIIHISNLTWKTGSEKPLKIFQLAGKVAHESFFHHGSASLENAIITMAQRFKNNAPLLEEVGQFGTLRQPEASAPRYIGTKLTPYFRLIYKDFELLNYKEEEGEKIEPEYFLPIVPMVLVNGSSGIAVGFSSNILNRNLLELVETCEMVLKGKKIKPLTPTIFSFNGEFIPDTENHKRWIIRGKFVRMNTTTIRVVDLPISMTYEKYENLLDALVESGKIQSYDDNCKENIDYVIKFKRAELEKLKDEDLIKLLKLEEYSTEIFNTLDEFGKLKQFESDVEIINYFVKFRLTWYQKRKDYLLDKMKRELLIMTNRVRFIKSIIDKKLEVRNKPKAEIISNLDNMKFDKVDGDYDYLLRMAIWSLTKEMYEKLLKEIETKKQEIDQLEKKEPKSIYLEDLKELKSKIQKN